MKVLIVSNTFPPADISGVGSLAQELLLGLGGEAQMEVLTRQGSGEGVISTGGRKVLFPVHAARRAPLAGPQAPGVIHVNESDGVMIALAVALRRFLGRPTPRLAATFQVSYWTEARVVRPLTVEGVTVSRPTRSELIFKYLRAPLLALAGKVTARLADRVVACSSYTAREVAADYGVSEATVVTIPNGIRPGPLPAERPPRDGPLRALFVGRLRTRKALAVLIHALRQDEAREVTLTVVGGGEQERAVAQEVIRLGLERRVRFVGKLAREAVAAHYRAADVFVLPSTYEGFPVAILEAMAAGLPVVATRVAGVPEAVADGVTGVVVEPEDARGLAAALGSLEKDREALRRMGIAARRRVEEEFSVERVGRAYLELWQGLAEDRQSQRG